MYARYNVDHAYMTIRRMRWHPQCNPSYPDKRGSPATAHILADIDKRMEIWIHRANYHNWDLRVRSARREH